MKRVASFLAVQCRLWLLMVVAGGAPAVAGCPAANQYSFSFANQTAATLNYANTYTYTATSTALGSQSFSVNFITNGLSSTLVGGNQMPNISNMVTDGVAATNLVIGGTFSSRTADVSTNTRVIVTRFTFATPIRDFTVQVNDVDFATNQYRDWLHINGINGASTYDPSMTTPFGNNNSAAGPKSNASSTVLFGVSTTPVSVTTVRQGVGTSTSGNNANNGTVTATFAQPVTTVEVRYGNYPLTTGETTTGQQAFGIQSISYCPMPSVTMTKTSAPWSDPQNGTINPKLIPGADLIYTLTVSNSNSSPIDANALVLTDPLPTGTTFYNGDIDDAGALTSNYEFVPGSSGLSFAAGNLTYSNNGGTTYTYAPAAGYDAAVNAIRLNPQGAMAANSSFSIKFRTRIK